jgi:hypothetical protein
MKHPVLKGVVAGVVLNHLLPTTNRQKGWLLLWMMLIFSAAILYGGWLQQEKQDNRIKWDACLSRASESITDAQYVVLSDQCYEKYGK